MASASFALLVASAYFPTTTIAVRNAPLAEFERCDSNGGCTQGSVMLQVSRGVGKKDVSGTVSDEDVPELPPPYSAENASSVDAGVTQASLLQRNDAPTAAELEQFRLMKDLRAKGHTCPYGKSFAPIADTEATFKFDCRLWRAARYWSSEMARTGVYSHVNAGSNPCQRTYDYGLATCTENIAAGKPDPQFTFKQWMDSDGHCVNMMDAALNRFGVGLVSDPNSVHEHYWTQSIGISSEAADDSCLAGVDITAPYTTSAPAPPPPFEGPCEDRDRYCTTSYKAYCDYENVKTQCPLTCGVCQAVTPTTEVTTSPEPPSTSGSAEEDTAPADEEKAGEGQTCVDKDQHCAKSYKNFCYLQNIKDSCPMTCGLCTPSVTVESGCEDKDPHCAKSYKNFCYLQNIKDSCPKTCGVCQ